MSNNITLMSGNGDQDVLLFVSHFQTHATVWSVHEIQDDPNSDYVKMLTKKGIAVIMEDGKPYLVNIRYFTHDKAADWHVYGMLNDEFYHRYTRLTVISDKALDFTGFKDTSE